MACDVGSSWFSILSPPPIPTSGLASNPQVAAFTSTLPEGRSSPNPELPLPNPELPLPNPELPSPKPELSSPKPELSAPNPASASPPRFPPCILCSTSIPIRAEHFAHISWPRAASSNARIPDHELRWAVCALPRSGCKTPSRRCVVSPLHAREKCGAGSPRRQRSRTVLNPGLVCTALRP